MSKENRITVILSDSLLEYLDNECKNLSTEVMTWNRSTYIRHLLVKERDGLDKDSTSNKKESDFYETKSQNNTDMDDGYYGDLLNMSGYK